MNSLTNINYSQNVYSFALIRLIINTSWLYEYPDHDLYEIQIFLVSGLWIRFHKLRQPGAIIKAEIKLYSYIYSTSSGTCILQMQIKCPRWIKRDDRYL